MIAALTLRTLDPFGTGKLVLFQVTYDRDWHFFEILFFIILAAYQSLHQVLAVWSTCYRVPRIPQKDISTLVWFHRTSDYDHRTSQTCHFTNIGHGCLSNSLRIPACVYQIDPTYP